MPNDTKNDAKRLIWSHERCFARTIAFCLVLLTLSHVVKTIGLADAIHNYFSFKVQAVLVNYPPPIEAGACC